MHFVLLSIIYYITFGHKLKVFSNKLYNIFFKEKKRNDSKNN